ncbi:hypothetical protein FHX57_007460 [Paraburkholderia tropica]|uniref:hypothetical protein n=1 Tax=Paraburkholderia tropica TaxID=92647 RepID=UPI000944D126|nr:hypothetical protein [Paraburkholderia tropica]MBB3005072.1 hypothetical protein [Paraburkholderia tropica]MBB6323990.1 hypothetical protein [Paraburkholderia tropica]
MLLIISKACFFWVVAYVFLSAQSAFWAGARHSCIILLLELEPHRARGRRELARARLLRWFGLSAVVALPVAIATFIVAIVQ